MEHIIVLLSNIMKIIKNSARVVMFNDVKSQLSIAHRDIEYVLKKLCMTDNLYQYDLFIDQNYLSKEDKIFVEQNYS